jgi:hypothetical protein
MLAFLSALLLSLGASAPPPYTVSSGVVLTPALEREIGELARAMYKETRHRIHITSGVRPPRAQARAMYGKLMAGGSLSIYRRAALVEPIRKVYREGKKKRWKKERIIAAMAAELQGQVDAGRFLSRHLAGRAFDVRSTGMRKKTRATFRRVAREVGGLRVLEEGRPPHFHLEVLGGGDDGEDDGDVH